jgi:parallel beta-helix repeat protein
LKYCIGIPGSKRDYKFWSDSNIIADEWCDTINLTLQRMKIFGTEEEEGEDENDENEKMDGSVSTGNFIVENSYGEDIEGRIDYGQFSKKNNDQSQINKKSQEEELLQSCINEKDGFDIQLYTTHDYFAVHQTLLPKKWNIEPYSRRKQRNQSTVTLEKAILEAQPGDTIVLLSGQHFVTRTLVIDRSIEIIGEKDSEIVMLQDQESAQIIAQPVFCVIAPFAKISNITFTYACVESQHDHVPIGLDDFILDSRTVLNQMLNSNMDQIVSQRQTLGVHFAKSILQICRGQLIISACKFSVMKSPFTVQIQELYDGLFASGSSQVLISNCEFSNCKHGISAAVSSSIVANNCVMKDLARHGLVVTQQANAVLESCEFSNLKCGTCFLNQSSGIVRMCTFVSSSCTISDYAKVEFVQNSFSVNQENVQASMVVYSGSSTGEFSSNVLSSNYGMFLCLTDTARVNVSHNQFKRDGENVLDHPCALVTGKAQATVPDEKQKKDFTCHENACITVV